jgi:hypothetical protein
MMPPVGVEALGYAEPGAATARETTELASILGAGSDEANTGAPNADADAATQTEPAAPGLGPDRRPPPRP